MTRLGTTQCASRLPSYPDVSYGAALLAGDPDCLYAVPTMQPVEHLGLRPAMLLPTTGHQQSMQGRLHLHPSPLTSHVPTQSCLPRPWG